MPKTIMIMSFKLCYKDFSALLQFFVTHLNTGHMGSLMSFTPWSKEENQGAEVESSRQFDQRRSAFSLAERDR